MLSLLSAMMLVLSRAETTQWLSGRPSAETVRDATKQMDQHISGNCIHNQAGLVGTLLQGERGIHQAQMTEPLGKIP